MTIIGGLIVSQVLTLYTTPVIYLLLDRLHQRLGRTPLDWQASADWVCGRRNKQLPSHHCHPGIAGKNCLKSAMFAIAT